MICYTKPSITQKEIAYATDAAQNGWGERCYDYVHKFEKAFAQHLGVKYAVATSSCTGALTMGLVGLGIQADDEIILPDTTWIACAAPIVHMGAKPIFVDIDPITWCIDPDQVVRAITPKTRAIMAVHLYGNVCNMETLLEIAKKYNIFLIEDAAEALGSCYNGKPCGSMGEFGTFSFHGTKTLTTGEGGMFVTNNHALYEHVTTLSNHGRPPNIYKHFFSTMNGFKFKMSNIQAAIGLAQLERIDELIQRKQDILHYYKDALSSYDFIQMNYEDKHITNGAWMPSVVFAKHTKVTREILVNSFAKHNIDARVFFNPLSSMPMYLDRPNNINAYDIPTRAINLPSYHDMLDADQNYIISIIHNIVSSIK